MSSILDRQGARLPQDLSDARDLAGTGLHPFAIAWDRKQQAIVGRGRLPAGRAGDHGVRARRAARAQFARTRPRPGFHLSLAAFHPGDVSVSGAQVFVSDSRNGLVFRLAAERARR